MEELLNNGDAFVELVSQLPHFADIDRLCSSLVLVPKQVTVTVAQQQIINLVQLKRVIGCLPSLQHVCLRLQSALFQTIGLSLKTENIKMLQHQIDEVIEENATISKNNQENMRAEIVFATKSGVKDVLDVARSAYTETIEGKFNVHTKFFFSFDLSDD